MNKKIWVIFFIALIAGIIILEKARSDTITTPVHFYLPVSVAFTVDISFVTGGPWSPPGPTADIYYNASAAVTDLQPCNIDGTACGNYTIGGYTFEYDNTGNVNITIQVQFDAAYPSGVTSVDLNSSASWATCHSAMWNVNNTAWTVVCSDINTTDIARAWMVADFDGTAVPETTLTLTHNSTQS
jgi:hypothetical protein